ncbi:MAG: TIGR03084 family metal-binding protein [Rhodobacteraceae bacterium]|nr:TIGR03084 family metal-binding protein [Paracoccaceae bacterium]
MIQAEDFRQESRALAAVLEPLGDKDFDQPTLFKGWTIDHVIGHLHMFNVAATATLESDAAFQAVFAPIAAGLAKGQSLLDTQFPWLDGLKARALFEAWRNGAEQTADAYANADPKTRVAWAGPQMSALSSITARQMETWAHGQEVFDVLGAKRLEKDRIRNIAHLGVSTFGWTFVNRGLGVPDAAPHVRLTGPSGVVWDWNMPQEDNGVRGLAVEFAQVVTQTRNVAETSLEVTGRDADVWMQMAQCFAGPPIDPPVPGTRFAAFGNS